MQRSLQLQLLSFLAALSALGAAMRPTFDTMLFAAAFVFGTLLLHARERMEGRRLGMVGALLGTAIPWTFAATRAWSSLGARLPPKMTAAVIVAAAVVPTGIFFFDAIRSLKNRAPNRQPE